MSHDTIAQSTGSVVPRSSDSDETDTIEVTYLLLEKSAKIQMYKSSNLE